MHCFSGKDVGQILAHIAILCLANTAYSGRILCGCRAVGVMARVESGGLHQLVSGHKVKCGAAGESEASGWSEEFGSRSGNGETVLGQ